MLKKLEPFSLSMLENLHTPGAGYDILRYISLPDLLGKESSTILYFMGKNLARKFEFETLEDIYYFFQQIGWEILSSSRRDEENLSSICSRILSYTDYKHLLKRIFD